MRKCLVLLSSYNGEEYIEDQIESIIGQKGLEDISLAIRDDGSKDGTVKIVEGFIEKGAPIRLFKGENVGFVGSFVWLLKYAKSQEEQFDYFSLSDQDDVWDSDKIQCAVEQFENNAVPNMLLYCSSSKAVNAQLVPLKYKSKKYEVNPYSSLILTFSPGHTYVFRTELLNVVCNCDYKKIYCHDSFIYTVASVMGGVFYDGEPHSKYRQYGKNQLGTSNTGFIQWVKERLKRMKRGDLKKYGIQIKYIHELLGDQMDNDLRFEIEKFLSCNSKLLSRIQYSFVTKLTRQRRLEDILFKIAYILGKYKG